MDISLYPRYKNLILCSAGFPTWLIICHVAFSGETIRILKVKYDCCARSMVLKPLITDLLGFRIDIANFRNPQRQKFANAQQDQLWARVNEDD